MFDMFEQTVIERQVALNEICPMFMVTSLEFTHSHNDNAKIFDALRKFNHLSSIHPIMPRSFVHVSRN
jgi:hypothetical protein